MRKTPIFLLYTVTTVIGGNLAMMVKDKLQMYFLMMIVLWVMGMGTQKSHMHLEAAWPQ